MQTSTIISNAMFFKSTSNYARMLWSCTSSAGRWGWGLGNKLWKQIGAVLRHVIMVSLLTRKTSLQTMWCSLGNLFLYPSKIPIHLKIWKKELSRASAHGLTWDIKMPRVKGLLQLWDKQFWKVAKTYQKTVQKVTDSNWKSPQISYRKTKNIQCNFQPAISVYKLFSNANTF